MKKMMLVLVAVCCSATMFATEVKNGNNFDLSLSADKLNSYLLLDGSQNMQVREICNYFDTQISNVRYSSELRRAEKFRYAIYSNLKLMKETLSHEQYVKYLRLVNVTLQNRGLDRYFVES